MSDLIADLYRQNEWANLRLLAACRGLTDEQLDATAVGSFGSIRTTLMHLLSAEQYYVELLGGAVDSPRFQTRSPFPGLDVLEAAAKASAAGLAERARVTPGRVIHRAEEGTAEEIDAEVILVQAVNHSTEHRSQVCTVMTVLGVTPPEIDGWTWGEQAGRMRSIGS